LRGAQGGELPPVRTINVSQYEEELEAAFAEATQEQLAETELLEHGLVLLGLADPGDFSAQQRVEDLSEGVLAFYSRIGRDVTVIEREGLQRRDDTEATVTLAHEFVHVLQDQEQDLGRLEEQHSVSYDGNLALRSVTEGEAVMLEAFFSAALWGLSLHEADYGVRFAAPLLWAPERFGDTSPLLAAPMYFPYTYGPRYVFNAFVKGGMEAVSDIYDAIPTATLSIMLSETEMVGVTSVPVEEAETGPDGYELFTSDVLGAFILELFLSNHGATTEQSALALGWQGDRFECYVAEQGGMAVTWRIRFSAADAAQQFLDLLSTPSFAEASAWSVGREESVVTIAAADEADVLDTWPTELASPSDEVVAEDARIGAPKSRLADVVRRRLQPVL
jgi:hypothetical protein